MIKKQQKKSQQLIEFLLVVPFMVIILGIVTEYAYALNINMTLTQGLKTVASNVYSKISPNSNDTSIQAQLKADLTKYLQDNNVPVLGENNLQVGYTKVSSQNVILMCRYTYFPAFTLPNVYFKVFPDQFDFLATTTVPVAFLSSNNYSNSVNSTTLDKIWSTSADFSSPDSFNSSKNGVLKSCTDARNSMLFLVKNTNTTNLYALVKWDGSILTEGPASKNMDITTGKIWDCTSSCVATSNNFVPYVTAKNYYNIIMIHDPDAQDINTYKTYWAYKSSGGSSITVDTSTDLSDTTTDGIIKRSIAMILPPSTSTGNFDNISSSANIVKSFGSLVFTTQTSINTSTILTGTPPSKNYNFN